MARGSNRGKAKEDIKLQRTSLPLGDACNSDRGWNINLQAITGKVFLGEHIESYFWASSDIFFFNLGS